MDFTRERLGDLLVKAEVLERERLDEALEYQKDHGGRLGAILVGQLLISEEQLSRTLAEQKGLEHVSLARMPIDREAVACISEHIALRRLMIPIAFKDGKIVVAIANPLDVEALDDLELRTGRKVIAVVAAESEIRYAIDKYLSSQVVLQQIADGAEEEEVDEDAGTDVPIIRLVNQLVKEAVLDGASDIHIEPGPTDVRVRYRIDGVLHEVTRLPRHTRGEMVSRIKVMADMDIAERRRPQDGRIQMLVEGLAVDLRVSIIPTPLGESITIRVLNRGLEFRDVEDLEMSPHVLEAFGLMLKSAYGAVLVSGPTGSGKTTTLYAALKRLNTEERKILTIEDPIEYQMEGITQMGVNNTIGLSFAVGLRQILRSDPDVVMVGEMRDHDTAETAVRAALTGHLVLSSIHTNDAPSALTRLADMRVPPYVASSALVGVIAQRLVRTLCPECRTPAKAVTQALKKAGFEEEHKGNVKAFAAVGCEECNMTGFKGRMGVYEIMLMSDTLRKLFLAEAASDELRSAAIAGGMRTLRQDAIDKVAAGLTSIDEIARVVT